jgi:C-terminal processing protease CtpA/Prc
MLRRISLWRLGFASAVVLLFAVASACAAEESRTVDLENRLAFGWALLHDNSLYAERLPDWDACRAQYGSALSHVDEKLADDAMKKLLSSVHDDYTFFRNRAQTARFKVDLEQRGVVRYHVDADGVAYIQLRTFASRHTAEELRDALRDVECARRIVLDLRGNRGGLVQQAFLAYSMFVDEGLFASFRGRNCGRGYTETLMVTRTRLARDYNGKVHKSKRTANMTAHKPLMILIDGDTRSASELLAGALHDCGRAQLVGTKTYGKGVVQDTWQLGDGSSVRITTGRAYLAKSGCIDKLGLQPDVAKLPDLKTISVTP